MSPLRINLFGKPQVSWNGESAVALKPAARNFLVFLLLHQYRHPRLAAPRRDLLLNQFWGERDERRARRCLSTTLWRLRRELEPEGVPNGTYLVVGDDDEVGFNFASNHWLDVAAFEENAAEGLSLPVAAMGERQVQALEQAQALYTGDLFEGSYDVWIVRHRERLHLLYLRCLGRLLDYHDRAGAHRRCLTYGRKILRADPLREQIHRQMILLYLKLGRQAEAVQQYHACRAILQEELGIEPMEETVRLYESIKSGDANGGVARNGHSEPAPDLQEVLGRLQDAVTALAAAEEELQSVGNLIGRLLHA